MGRLCREDQSLQVTVEPCLADFSLKFQNVMFDIVPSSLFLFIAFFRIISLKGQRACHQNGNFLGLSKLTTTVLTVFVDLAFLGICCRFERPLSQPFVTALSLQLAVSVVIVSLSWLEHGRSIRPSSLLQTYLLITIPLNAVTLRALRIRLFLRSTVSISAAHLALRFVLLTLESLDKSVAQKDGESRTLKNEETCGLFGERLMLWLLPLYRRGYRQKLTPENLIPLDDDLKSHKTWTRFDQSGSWHQSFPSKYSLLLALGSNLRNEILIAIIPQVLMIITATVKPFLVTILLNYVAADPQTVSNMQGYGIVLAFALDYSLASFAQSWSTQCLIRIQTHARDFLTTAIYQKTLSLKSTAADEGSPVSLMNVDVERFLFGITKLHDLWGGFIMTLIGLYLLYIQVGWAFIAPFVVIGISTVVSGQVGKSVAPRQLAWSQKTNSRVDYLTEMLSSMKTIKMLGLPDITERAVTGLRVEEIGSQTYVRKVLLWIWTCVISMFPLSTLATFVVYGLLPRPNDQKFDAQRVFTSLAILKFFTAPMLMVLQFWALFISGLACMERIQRFLQRADFEESREFGTVVANGSSGKVNGFSNEPRRSSLAVTSISVKNGAFAYGSEGPVLQDLTVDIDRGRLTMIVGRVGSGKSTFLNSLLGETQMTNGSLFFSNPDIAFCAQTPWLQNKSIRENVVGVSEFDESWYHNVISFCSLDEDIDDLADGDETMVGSKGVALSGGQKNRLSLARAVYSRKPVLLLDDILSGLDRRTEHAIFTRLFGRDGIFRGSDTTVVLVTHSRRYLQEADKIIMLEAGRILKQGPFKDLVTSGALEQISEVDDRKNDLPAINTLAEQKSPKDPTEKPKSKTATAVNTKTLSGEADTPENSLATYKFFFQGFGKTGLLVFLFVATVCQGLQTLQTVWLEWWSASADPTQLKYYVGFTLISLLAFITMAIMLHFYFLVALPRLSLFMHAKQLDALVHATLSFLTATESGKILNRFSQDITMVDGNIPMCFLNFVALTLGVSFSTVLVLVATPHVAICLPLVLFACYAIQRVFLRTSKQLRILDLEAKAPLVSHLTETYSGLTTIRAFGWSDNFSVKDFVFLEDAQVPFYLMASIQNWLVLVLDLLISGLAALVSLVAVALRSKMNPGFLGLALIGIMDLGNGFRFLLQNWVMLDSSLGAVVRIKEFAEETPREKSEDSSNSPSHWPSAGVVEFKDLTASYAPTGETVLKALNLTVPARSEIGIVGRSGSGKTSTIATLSGLLHVKSGSVAIDGIDVKTIPLETLRSHITVLPQDPFFLPHRQGGNTVRSNLWPWAEFEDNATVTQQEKRFEYRSLSTVQSAHEDSVHPPSVPSDSAMVSALEKVGLWRKFVEYSSSSGSSSVLEDAAESPNIAAGGATADGSEALLGGDVVTERTPLVAPGSIVVKKAEPLASKVLSQRLDLRDFLSHGERQLFCLARALLTKNKILVLDEATSSVDTQTEQLMLSIISDHFKGWTKIAIAHRLDTILGADQVVVLGGGRVLEIGDPKDLLQKDGGIFKGMVEGGE